MCICVCMSKLTNSPGKAEDHGAILEESKLHRIYLLLFPPAIGENHLLHRCCYY